MTTVTDHHGTLHRSRGRRVFGAAIAIVLCFNSRPQQALGHDDPPGNKMSDLAVVTEVWTDQSWDDGAILPFADDDAELCVVAIFQHHGHDRSQMKITVKVGDQELESVVPYFDVVEKCNDDVNMNGSEAHRNSLPWYDQVSGKWRLVGGSSNGITNLLQSERHDECTPRAPWTVNVTGYEHDEDQASILKKIAKALTDAAALLPDTKWQTASKAGAALAEFIASLFSNRKLGEVTLDFPPSDDGSKTASGAHLNDVTAQVMQETRGDGGPCPTTSASPTPSASPAMPATATATPTAPDTSVPTPTSPDTVVATPTTPDTSVPTPSTPDTTVPTPPTSLPLFPLAGVRARAPTVDCGADVAHAFAKRLTHAARSWAQLQAAVAELPSVGTASGEITPDPAFVKQLLAKAIGNIGSIIATAEVEEAAGTVDEGVRAQAAALVAEGDGLRDQAIPAGDATLLAQALARYRTATESLLPLLHPECQVAPEVACARAVAHASRLFGKAQVAALVECESAKTQGKLPAATDCHSETKATYKITKAAAAMHAALDKACGGIDKTCGGDANDEAPAALGFAATCPGSGTAVCRGTLVDCGDVAQCLTCIVAAAGKRVVDLAFANVAPTDPKSKAGKPLNKCQRAIGRGMAGFLAAEGQALQRCWDARLKGKHANPCPSPGDGKAAGALAKAAAKLENAICTACGGRDKACGGGDDFSAVQIGFPAFCEDVRIPDGRRCAAPVETLEDVVECARCVGEYAVACTDAARVADFVTYPEECRP